MPIPQSDIKERLSMAYVTAVVARAGAKFVPSAGPEYGTHGTVRKITEVSGGAFVPTGHTFDCQLKATTTCQMSHGHVIYDMEVTAYNKLANWAGTAPCILVLLRLPTDLEHWVDLDEERLLLRNCCYWEHVAGSPSQNQRSQRIQIPRKQVFTPDSVNDLLDRVAGGAI